MTFLTILTSVSAEKTFKALIKVVDTDYSNYAVIYKCSNLQPTPIGNVISTVCHVFK